MQKPDNDTDCDNDLKLTGRHVARSLSFEVSLTTSNVPANFTLDKYNSPGEKKQRGDFFTFKMLAISKIQGRFRSFSRVSLAMILSSLVVIPRKACNWERNNAKM